MRRGGSLLITILLLLAAFWAGIQYERNNCRIDLPEDTEQVDQSVKCRPAGRPGPSPAPGGPPPRMGEGRCSGAPPIWS